MSNEVQKPLYRERVRPSYSSLSSGLLLIPAMWLVLAPFSAYLGLWVGFLLASTLIGLRVRFAAVISLDKKTLRVGSAMISRKLLGKVELIERSKQFSERGPNLDARAYAVFQASAQGLIKIQIKDAKDPTPYWLFSSRNPEVFMTALETAN